MEQKNSPTIPRISVVGPFHFGPAPASQDGGSSSRSSSVVHNFCCKKSSEKFHTLIQWDLFYFALFKPHVT